jgi:tungstate transport system ATP-binding protein
VRVDPLYRVLELRQSYGRSWELSVPAFEIPEGGLYAILGPNGAGKSTLLRMLSLVEPADSGRIEYRGRRIKFPVEAALRREISMVFQRPVMFAGSVWQNLTLGLRIRNLDPGEHLMQLVAQLDLEALLEASARKISGGEMQRVALARALACKPRVLLLDEPTSNLDPYYTGLIEHIIREVSKSMTTVILVTQNVFQARRLAERAAILIDGNILEQGEAEVVLDQPGNPAAEAFLRGELVFKQKGERNEHLLTQET